MISQIECVTRAAARGQAEATAVLRNMAQERLPMSSDADVEALTWPHPAPSVTVGCMLRLCLGVGSVRMAAAASVAVSVCQL